ncbi:hypothetical protein E2562_022759 [Oryza meyeriana var. granulata]|uniref:Uncharacterized protein n=1 Tax=Oryza meyeriana var. granulata TaxID=110450 RepID=A0A6G1FAZ1_9ORYZ|nr:hypothetical protein E2562_022759 [Oryza meyeriana var. granulata]
MLLDYIASCTKAWSDDDTTTTTSFSSSCSSDSGNIAPPPASSCSCPVSLRTPAARPVEEAASRKARSSRAGLQCRLLGDVGASPCSSSARLLDFFLLKILAHAAVGAFLMHCGYSSVIEGLWFGHPLIMLPLFLDHFPIARYLEGAKKVGMQVARDGKADGPFNRDGVAGIVRAAVVDEESKKLFAANARKLQEVVPETECHERCIDAFIQQHMSYKE